MSAASASPPARPPSSTTSARAAIAQAAAREDVDLVYQQMQEDIWECSQCFSCLRCPRGNNPGGIVTIMREVAVRNGLASAKQALVGYSRIIYKIMSTGTQVSPDMLQSGRVPRLGSGDRRCGGQPGPVAPGTACRDDAHYLDRVVRRRQDAGRAVPHLAARPGALDMIADVDSGLHSILLELMEERLEEEGIQL